MKLMNSLAAAAVIGTAPMIGETSSITLQDFYAQTHFDIEVEHGIATLTGYTSSWVESLQAEQTAEAIEGVVLVRNRVTVAG